MKSQKSKIAQPFWEDEQVPHTKSFNKTIRGYGRLLTIFFIAVPILIALYANIILFQSSIVSWFCTAYFLLYIPFGFYRNKRRKSNISTAKETQQKAREITMASIIGSAIHIAGHPLLDRDQQVVIALKDDHIDIFNYSNPVPLDTISIERIKDVKTVTYDDDRIPHTEVIDSAAQALQLDFTLQGKAYTCLFRRMQNAKPIDWYHAIQKVRMNLNN